MLSSHFLHIPSGYFPRDFIIKILYAFSLSQLSYTSNHNPLDFTTLTMQSHEVSQSVISSILHVLHPI